ncbi:MAG: YkgJ family cysteine cluster protein [Desulfobulbaceae bacterium]|nr:YkgJ family cysteine cluster protein [Desulfobulbaceae bacterium]
MQFQQRCQRCGTCCKNGGPILHQGDLPLLRQGIFSLQNLVTIRKGEPSFNPFTEMVEPASYEMIKIAGKGASWECIFYDAGRSACIIHADRPLECRLLQCWDTGEIEAIHGRECLCRFDLVADQDPIRDHIQRHEQQCTYALALPFLDQLSSPAPDKASMEELQGIMQQDLLLRDQAVCAFGLSLQQELFYFGRPLFQSLQHPRLRVAMSGSSLRLELVRSA